MIVQPDGKCKAVLRSQSGDLVVYIICVFILFNLTAEQTFSRYSFCLEKQRFCVLVRGDKSPVVIGAGLRWPGQVAKPDCIRLMTK